MGVQSPVYVFYVCILANQSSPFRFPTSSKPNPGFVFSDFFFSWSCSGRGWGWGWGWEKKDGTGTWGGWRGSRYLENDFQVGGKSSFIFMEGEVDTYLTETYRPASRCRSYILAYVFVCRYFGMRFRRKQELPNHSCTLLHHVRLLQPTPARCTSNTAVESAYSLLQQ